MSQMIEECTARAIETDWDEVSTRSYDMWALARVWERSRLGPLKITSDAIEFLDWEEIRCTGRQHRRSDLCPWDLASVLPPNPGEGEVLSIPRRGPRALSRGPALRGPEGSYHGSHLAQDPPRDRGRGGIPRFPGLANEEVSGAVGRGGERVGSPGYR